MLNNPNGQPLNNNTLRQILDSHDDGYVLPREFYASDEIYGHDIKSYWNQNWIWVGHVCQLPEKGDFFLFNYGTESIIVARDREGGIGAFINVCRHRGSRVCVEKSGNKKVFSCPYHAWTYELNGSLRAAREMGEGFDRKDFGLLKAHVFVFQGMIFVCTAEAPPNIQSVTSQIESTIAPYRLDRLKIAHEASYPVPANWKLAIENYMECYHCAPAHLEYSKSHSLKDPASMREGLMEDMHSALEKAGVSTASFAVNGAVGPPVGIDLYLETYPLFPGYQTGSKNGEPLAPLLGDLKSFAGAARDLQIGIINNWLIYCDHVVGYRFVPTATQETDIQIVWYVRDDAGEGKDYQKDDLTWLWHVTSLDDERIIRVNQEGVNSYHYKPGPLSDMEWGIRAFYSGYLNQMKQICE